MTEKKPWEYHYLVDFVAETEGLNLTKEWIEILNEANFIGGRILR
jgi:hypothetical protein